MATEIANPAEPASGAKKPAQAKFDVTDEPTPPDTNPDSEKRTKLDDAHSRVGEGPESEADKEAARRELANAKREYEELGGWQAFKSGEWLFKLVEKAFRSYYAKANAEYFRAKYSGKSDAQIADKLITITARYASLYGVITGAVVSTDEIVAIMTGGEGGVGIPANVAVAAMTVGAEAISLVRLHLQLIANLAKLTGCPLDPDDPEDILIILAYAAGGGAAELAGKLGMQVGKTATKAFVRKYISKEVLETLKSLAKRIGIKLLQRSIIQYTVPVVSMLIGGGWNYVATKTVGKTAEKHLHARANERKQNGDEP